MIKISREEFESKVQDLIDGKITREKLIKELETDSRTLNNKIREMSTYNQELYFNFVSKFPYRTKERNDIDYEALVIEIVKTGMTSDEAASKYNISVRTIQRRVNDLERENPYLVDIYKQIKLNNSKQEEANKELKHQIDELISRPVVLCEINGQTRRQLEEVERIYNERCLTMPKEEAARGMGISREQIFKMMNQLKRLKAEDEAKSFKGRLRAETTKTEFNKVIEKTEIYKDDIKEGEER